MFPKSVMRAEENNTEQHTVLILTHLFDSQYVTRVPCVKLCVCVCLCVCVSSPLEVKLLFGKHNLPNKAVVLAGPKKAAHQGPVVSGGAVGAQWGLDFSAIPSALA